MPVIQKDTARIFDLQNPTAKMSKSAESDAGVLWMLDEPRSSAKKIMRAVTDCEGSVRFDREEKPGVSNLLVIYAALTGRQIAAIEDEYAGRGYGDFKKGLAEVVVAEFGPVRERALELLDDPAELDRVLAANAERGLGGRERHPRRRLRQGRAAPPGVAPAVSAPGVAPARRRSAALPRAPAAHNAGVLRAHGRDWGSASRNPADSPALCSASWQLRGDRTPQAGPARPEEDVRALEDEHRRRADADVAQCGQREVPIAIPLLRRPLLVELLAVAFDDEPAVDHEIDAAHAGNGLLQFDAAAEDSKE